MGGIYEANCAEQTAARRVHDRALPAADVCKGIGRFFHEAVGIGALFAVHVLLNLSKLRGLPCLPGQKPERLLLFLSDVVLTVCMPIVIVTGALIARELFTIDSGLPWLTLFCSIIRVPTSASAQ